MRQLFIGTFFLFCVFASKAQYDSVQEEPTRIPANLLNLKVDFTNLINPRDPALLFSVEYSLNDGAFSINHEGGYIVGVYAENEEINEFTGFKTRHELRFFLNDDRYAKTRPYASFNFQYRYLAVEDRYTLGYECEGANCEYLKNFKGQVKTDQYVVQLRLGIQSYFTERLIFEFDAGFGYQRYVLRRSSINGGRFMEPNRLFTEDAFGTLPHLSVSGKLGFVLFRKKG